MHAVKEELPAAASESAGHAEHVLSDVCPTAEEYLPAKQSVHGVDPYHKDDHVPVKPLRVTEPSDVNVTLRNPVDEVYTLDEPRDPECLRIRCDNDSQLHR